MNLLVDVNLSIYSMYDAVAVVAAVAALGIVIVFLLCFCLYSIWFPLLHP